MERASHADGEVITWELELQSWKRLINYGQIREKQEEKVKGKGWETLTLEEEEEKQLGM